MFCGTLSLRATSPSSASVCLPSWTVHDRWIFVSAEPILSPFDFIFVFSYPLCVFNFFSICNLLWYNYYHILMNELSLQKSFLGYFIICVWILRLRIYICLLFFSSSSSSSLRFNWIRKERRTMSSLFTGFHVQSLWKDFFCRRFDRSNYHSSMGIELRLSLLPLPWKSLRYPLGRSCDMRNEWCCLCICMEWDCFYVGVLF